MQQASTRKERHANFASAAGAVMPYTEVAVCACESMSNNFRDSKVSLEDIENKTKECKECRQIIENVL